MIEKKKVNASSVRKYLLIGATVAALSIVGLSSLYTVDEGHVGVVKTWSEATSQVGPGLNFKIPFMQTVEEMEVRQRKFVEELSAATADRLAISASVSLNWTIDKEVALQLFVDYGGLAQFENRILAPKLRNAAKSALGRFTADQMVSERQLVVEEISRQMIEAVKDFPITVNSQQLENFRLPQKYLDAVLAKQEAKENAEREEHLLEQQRLKSLQAVNTAEADKKSKIARAEGEAQAILLKAEAEAGAIELVNEQLSKSGNYVDLVRAKAWDGKLPSTLIGEGSAETDILLNMDRGQ